MNPTRNGGVALAVSQDVVENDFQRPWSEQVGRALAGDCKKAEDQGRLMRLQKLADAEPLPGPGGRTGCRTRNHDFLSLHNGVAVFRKATASVSTLWGCRSMVVGCIERDGLSLRGATIKTVLRG